MPSIGRDELAEHIPRLYRVALRILGNHHAAEEVVQDVCVRVLEKAGGLDLHAQPTTWLHRVTTNCAVDRLRRDNVRERGRVRCELTGLAGSLESAPDRIAERREMQQLASKLVRTLPEDCRSAFLLTQLDGYTYDEAAEIEEKPRGTIGSRVARAKSQLLAAMTQASLNPADTRQRGDAQ